VLREEIHVRQTATTETVELPVTLRKQHAVIDQQDVATNPNEEEFPK
jgi:stress response protein YsnF